MKKILAVVLALIISVLFCACGEEEKANFPVVYGGVKFDKASSRVVSLSANATDLLKALGFETLLVGVSDWCDTAASVKRVGTADFPDSEAIIGLSPDLVITNKELPAELSQSLSIRKVKVIKVEYREDVEGLCSLYADLAAALGGDVVGRANGERAAEKLKNAIKDAKLEKPVKVLFSADGAGAVATGDTFTGKLLAELGMTNAAQSGKGWSYGADAVKAAAPEAIFCPVGTAQAVKELYPDTPAVKNGKVYEIDPKLTERQGSSLINAVSALTEPLK